MDVAEILAFARVAFHLDVPQHRWFLFHFAFWNSKTVQDSLLDMLIFCRRILQDTHDTVFIKTKMY